MAPALRRAAVAATLLAVTAAVYAGVRHHPFVNFDDRVFILQNPALPLGWTVAGLRQAVTTTLEAYWIPLTALSFQASWALHGFDPAGWLLTNVLLHAATSVVLFLALERMTGATLRSAVVAAVFAVHPLHVESVAWASERKDVLSGLCFALGLWAYGGARGDRLRPLERWGTLAALVLGLLAKPMLVTMPFVLLLCDVWPLRRPLGVRRVTEKLPMFAAVAAAAALTVHTQHAYGALALDHALALPERVANALASWVWYLRATAWPSGLGAFYPLRPVPPPAWTLVHAALLAGLTVAALRQARTRPWWTVGWLWFLGMLVPVIGLVQAGMQSRADRFMYLPLLGLVIPVVWSCPARLLRPAAAVAVVAYGVLAWVQVDHWRDTIALFERAVAVTDANPFAHTRLGEEYRAAGQLDLAEWHYREAIRQDPAQAAAHRMLASLRAARGDAAEAETLYVTATTLNPRDVQAWGDLGMLRLRRGAWAEAQGALAQAAALDATSLALATALGDAAARAGDPRAARDALRRAHDLAPGDTRTIARLAWLLAASQDDAVRDPATALALVAPLARAEPDAVLWRDIQAAAQAAMGRYDVALDLAGDARDRAAARGDAGTAATLDARLARYRAGQPWRE